MSETADAAPRVTPELQQQFAEEGYFILDGVIPSPLLALLREECAFFMGYQTRQAEEAGRSFRQSGRNWAMKDIYRKSPRLWRYIFSDLLAEICAATLGPDVQLFNEQWVVKGYDSGKRFAWHQDVGYTPTATEETRRVPFLTCWAALDDVDETNGTVYLLPHSRAGTKGAILEHTEADDGLTAYAGSDPGIPVIAPAGSIAVFSSYTLHCSGTNQTDRLRRVYVTQYTRVPLRRPDGTLQNKAVPFLEAGRNVYDPKADGVAE